MYSKCRRAMCTWLTMLHRLRVLLNNSIRYIKANKRFFLFLFFILLYDYFIFNTSQTQIHNVFFCFNSIQLIWKKYVFNQCMYYLTYSVSSFALILLLLFISFLNSLRISILNRVKSSSLKIMIGLHQRRMTGM